MESSDKVGAMAAEWARTNLLRMLATAVGFVIVWPYVLHLVSLARQALNRANAQERERTMALRALQERCAVLAEMTKKMHSTWFHLATIGSFV